MRSVAAVHLAEELAGAGNCERAFHVLRKLGSDYDSDQGYYDDKVRDALARVPFIRLRFSSRRFGCRRVRPCRVPDRKDCGSCRRRMCTAETTQPHDDAFRTPSWPARRLPTSSRAKCLWQIADAQMALSDAACESSTIDQLVALCPSFTDGRAKVAALARLPTDGTTRGSRGSHVAYSTRRLTPRASIAPPTPLPAARPDSRVGYDCPSTSGPGMSR